MVTERGRQSLRVLQVITDNDRRGAQVFAVDLHRGLSGLGFNVLTVALADGAVGGLAVHTLGRRRLQIRTLARLRSLARRADVVVGHGSTTLFACALTVRCRTPFVYRQISDSLFWARTRLRRARVRAALRRADRVIALWAGAATTLTEHFGVSPEQIEPIANAVVADDYPVADDHERREARRRLGLPLEADVVGYVGALVPEKGMDVGIEAMRGLADVIVVIAGDGPERPALEALAMRAEVDARFVGSLEHPRDVYAASDVVVLPSLGGDSMPATMIEAGMLERPCVSTAVGAIPEIIKDGETGFIVPIGRVDAFRTAVEALLIDRELRRRLGVAARMRCERHYTMHVIAQKWASTLASIGPLRMPR